MKNKLKYLILLFCGTVIYSCDDRTAAEIYQKEFIAPSKAGKVTSTELWKGGLLLIQLKESDGSESVVEVLNNREILPSIKRDDYLEKLPNSNKIILRRNDSVMLLDGINLTLLTDEMIDSLTPIDQWEREKINKWFAESEIEDQQE